LDKTKNGERHVLHVILPEAARMLREQKLRFGSVSELIIPTDRPGKKHYRWRRSWETALKQAGIEDFRFHDLRHCFASYLARQGHDAIQIADLTGHKSLAMVKRYSHLNPKSRIRNTESALIAMGLLK
jgi:integrase